MTDRRLSELRRKLLAVGGGTGIALAGMAGGSSAYASVVQFDNSAGDYTWVLEQWLDITRGPLDQDGYEANSAFNQYLYGFGETGADIDFSAYNGSPANDYGMIMAFGAGDQVDEADFYSSYGWALAARQSPGGPAPTGVGDWSVYVGNGTPGYVGLRFSDDYSVNHYGWMKVLWNEPEERFDALAWAYETEDDTPITITGDIPEPGTLALFAAGAGALLVASRRRRRRDSDEA